MEVKQVINNNFVIVEEETEMILLGKGIGFNRKKGDLIFSDEVKKIFYPTDWDAYNKFRDLLVNIPSLVVELSANIVTDIKAEIGREVNDVLYVTLMDHIHSALNRHRDGIDIKNNLLYEIQQFYPVEFKLGKKALQRINQEFEVSLIEDEAAFIALHIVNATMDDSENVQGTKITQLIKEVISIVRRYFKTTFDVDSVYYYRFVTHVRFFGQRLFSGYSHNNSESTDPLLEIIIERYPESYKCTTKIAEFLNDQYQTKIGKQEELYLTIHIQRIVEEHYKK